MGQMIVTLCHGRMSSCLSNPWVRGQSPDVVSCRVGVLAHHWIARLTPPESVGEYSDPTVLISSLAAIPRWSNWYLGDI
jgi:hypothetical protein